MFLDYWKTELQNIRYSNVFGIPMFGIQAPTIHKALDMGA